MRDARVIAPLLLDWYDRHARVLPWRVPPGGGPGNSPGADPYRVWLSEVMLQQTTVAAVRTYFERFVLLWPTVQDLAAAEEARVMAEWAGLGYYARARNLLACARAVAATGGFPETRDGLRALPGIGAYTSAAIAAIAFDQPETVVDGNVERVVARLFAVETPLPAARPRLAALAETLTPQVRPGDFAQAMMDLGATICTPRNPACGVCPLCHDCAARAAGIAASLPRKPPKAARPERKGIAWIARRGNAVVVEDRPASGLLGGTLAFPSAHWDGRDLPPPGMAAWRGIGHVRHVFSHFTLVLQVMAGDLEEPPLRGRLMALDQIARDALPGLMRKVWDLAQAEAHTDGAAPAPAALSRR